MTSQHAAVEQDLSRQRCESRRLSREIGEPLKYRSRPGHHVGGDLVASHETKGRRGVRNRFLTMIGSLGSLCPRGLPILLTTVPDTSSPLPHDEMRMTVDRGDR